MRTAVLVRLALVPVMAAVVWAAGSDVVRGQAGARERTLFVSAVDNRGEPVEGLDLEDFVVTEDGRRREILRVSRAIEPIDVAVLVDNSAAATSAISSIRRGLAGFASILAGPNQTNQIAIVGLADRPTILLDYTSSRERIEQGIGRLFSMAGSGMTLLDAISEVSSGLRRREATRAAIVVVITSGTEFSNRYAREVMADVGQASAALHAIVVGHVGMGSIAERERAIVLDTGTKTSGGQHVTLLVESAIEQALQKLARELSSQYKVVYGRPESLIPPEKIDVTSVRPGVAMRGTPARGQAGA